MPGRIKTIVDEYNKHAAGIIPATFFTVMIWAASQSLINEAVKDYVPMLQSWQVALIEIFVASFGLWFVTKRQEERDMKEEGRRLSMIINVGEHPTFGAATKGELANKFDVSILSVLMPSGNGCIRETSDDTPVSYGCALEASGEEQKDLVLYRAARGELK